MAKSIILYSFYFTEIAENEIDEAFDYISNNLCNLSAARKLYKKLINTINRIIENPLIYEDCSDYFVWDENIRRAIVNNFILVYEIDHESKSIRILRFIYYRRRIDI